HIPRVFRRYGSVPFDYSLLGGAMDEGDLSFLDSGEESKPNDSGGQRSFLQMECMNTATEDLNEKATPQAESDEEKTPNGEADDNRDTEREESKVEVDRKQEKKVVEEEEEEGDEEEDAEEWERHLAL